MPIRMSGLMSGLDTEGIVKELMSAQSLKKTKVVKAKTKLEWKQTKWAELNTKLTNLYNNYVSKMQLSTAYKTKKATVSDDSKVKVSAGTNAVNGNYTMQVNNIATSQYVTGGVINAKSASTKLADLDPDIVGKEINIKNGDKTTKFTVGADTTIAQFTKALTSVGLNASFDTDQKRLFISSKNTGLANAFSITSSEPTAEEATAKTALIDALEYSGMNAASKSAIDSAIASLQKSGQDNDDHDNKSFNAALDALAKASYESQNTAAQQAATTYVKAKLYSENYAANKTAAENDADLRAQYYNDDGSLVDGKTDDDYEKAVLKKADEDTAAYVKSQLSTDEVKDEIKTAVFDGKTSSDIAALSQEAQDKYYKDGVAGFTGMNGIDQDSERERLRAVANDYAGVTDRSSVLANSALTALGLADITLDADGKGSVVGTAPEGMAFIAASDSEILLNGAKLTSSTSTVNANGLSIELVGKTEGDESISFSVANDIDGVYDSIKGFLKEYNEVMKEMNSLYNAESAKGYEPLTSEEKEAMTDEDVKLWEDKIKGSLLRNDSTLSGIIQSMRSAMMGTVSYNGKSYALSSFGIMTSTNYQEGGLLHIYGDPDDSVYSGEKDRLKKALTEDPDAVVATLTGIFGNLRKTMMQKMAGSKYSSALTFYDDIKMKDDLKAYDKDIKDWEDRLADIEDSYYKKFTAMETALAKLQSQQNSLAGLFGG